VFQSVRVNDAALAGIVRQCADIPGQELFQWIDAAGERHRIDSNDVNEYLREATGGPFTAKDFRTWFASLEALQRLRGRPVGTQREIKRELAEVIEEVAARLGNTPTICRKCYIHPEILRAYAEGRLVMLKAGSLRSALRKLLRPTRRRSVNKKQQLR
jgi:DNA topoisomerase-1